MGTIVIGRHTGLTACPVRLRAGGIYGRISATSLERMMHMKKLMLLLAALLALGTICALAEEAEPTVYTSG